MNKSEFEIALKDCELFQQLAAELVARQESFRMAIEQALAIVATALSRQANAGVVVQNIERMEAQYARQAPNAERTEMLRLVSGLVRDLGAPQPPEPVVPH